MHIIRSPEGMPDYRLRAGPVVHHGLYNAFHPQHMGIGQWTLVHGSPEAEWLSASPHDWRSHVAERANLGYPGS